MFGSLGMFELLIIAGIALVVVGPEKFPPFAKAVIKTFRDLKTQIEETQREITKEIQPVRNELRELNKHKPEDYIDKITGGALTEVDSDFDYEYPYREHESTQKDKSEQKADAETQTEGAEPPDGTETFGAAAEPAADVPTGDEDINLEPDGPDWERYDEEQRTASGDGTD